MLYIVTPMYRLFVLTLDILDFIWGSYWDVLRTLLRALVPRTQLELRNKNVLITGAGQGVGRCLAQQFCQHGSNVYCWDIDQTALESAVDELSHQFSVAVAGDVVDVANYYSVQQAALKVLAKFGHIDVLVNNAGVMPTHRFLRQSPEIIEKTFSVNVLGNIWPLRAFLPGMYSRSQGSVVCVSSCCGLMGSANLVPYCASKHALRGLMEALNEEERYYSSDRRPLLHHLTVFPFVIKTRLASRPRTRLPWLLPLLTPEHVAAEIVRSVVAGEETLFLPRWMYPLFLFSRMWPRRMQQRFYDIVDAGVNEVDFEVNRS